MFIIDPLGTRMELGVGMGTTALLGGGGGEHQKHLSVANLRQRTINPRSSVVTQRLILQSNLKFFYLTLSNQNHFDFFFQA